MQKLYANRAVGISELKANPTAILQSAEREPVVILNRNKPTGYVVGAQLWETLTERLENLELTQVALTRLNSGEPPLKVSIDDL